MIKLIIFDLDGVLVETKHIHFQTLNNAIESIVGSNFIISEKEHLSIYDGLKTYEKLKILTREKGLSEEFYKEIWELKQNLTLNSISKLSPNNRLIEIMKKLREKNFKIACCSNSIRRSVLIILSKLGLIEFMDLILSNEDVKNGKPHPEIYWSAMSSMGFLPDETLIIEDSPHGLLAANRSKAHVLRVNNPEDITYEKILSILEKNIVYKKPKWKDNNLNVLIPMAGAGSRFENAGYTFPKPLIDVNGEPMIKVIVENLNIDANFIYIVQRNHREKYNLDTLLNLITPNCQIVEVDGVTQGAAVTTLLAKSLINNEQPLLISNSDQYVEWNSNEFLYKVYETKLDAAILTFKSTHPKWSFVKCDELGYVTEVAEKKPISDKATVGIYYWSKGSDYVRYAERMISKNIRTNNEFYVCPVFNQAIEDKKRIKTYDVEKMFGLGTPEDLKFYLENYK
jgi:HAD superfamily hydrolase (TIGR01509 family)